MGKKPCLVTELSIAFILDAGVDIVTVQKLAGHASPVTTAKYDRRGEETKRLAVQRLGF